MNPPVDPFKFHVPTRVRFGRGIRREIAATAAGYGRRAVLFAFDGFEGSPAALEMTTALHLAGVALVDRIIIRTEPDDAGVLEASARLAKANAEMVLAIGGGSVLDLAKAAALMADPGLLDELLAGVMVTRGGLPVIAVPTTAGTGSEVSHGAIVMHRSSGRKRAVRGPGVAAREAIVDPELSASAPAAIAANAGFDAIAHAVETAASRAASDLVIHLAGVALPRLLDAVPRLVEQPHDVEAAESAAYAALLMGFNLANSTTCLPHRFQYAIGPHTNTAHAVGVAAVLPAWLDRTILHNPEAIGRLARAGGLCPADASATDAATTLAGRIVDHLERTGMRRSLSELGVKEADIPELLDAIEGAVANDPGPVGREDLHALYLASL